jgi:hypothetical protein
MAQDVIYKTNGDKINAKIIEIVDNLIKYKTTDNINGPVRNINSSEVFMIKYANGQEELFKEPKNTPPIKNIQSVENTKSVSGNEVKKDDKYFIDNKNKYFTCFAFGYGQTYGGLGLKYQGRIGNIMGFGYHAGVGRVLDFSGNYKSSDLFWVNAGVKFFWFKGCYLDLSFGNVLNYAITMYFYDDFIHRTSSWTRYGTAYGTSLLVGIDLFFGKHFGLNVAAGGAFNLTESSAPRIFPTFDLGFIAKF